MVRQRRRECFLAFAPSICAERPKRLTKVSYNETRGLRKSSGVGPIDPQSKAPASVPTPTQREKIRAAAFEERTLNQLTVQRKVVEARDVVSIYLGAADGERLPTFCGGQHVTVGVPGVGERQYAISAYSKTPRHYRITVSRLRRTPELDGVASAYWHDVADRGDLVEVSEPAGGFRLSDDLVRPSVFVGAGIGVAPMVAMAEELAVRRPGHPATFLYETGGGATFPFAQKMRSLRSDLPNASWRLWFSDPRRGDRRGVDFDDEGCLDRAALASIDLSDSADFLVCGPDAFATSAAGALRDLGVPDERINALGLGPTGIVVAQADAELTPTEELKPCEVSLVRSAMKGVWKPEDGVLLDFVERLGVKAPFSCRTGMCGTCSQRVISGEVAYVRETVAAPKQGHVLICSAIPRSQLKLDL